MLYTRRYTHRHIMAGNPLIREYTRWYGVAAAMYSLGCTVFPIGLMLPVSNFVTFGGLALIALGALAGVVPLFDKYPDQESYDAMVYAARYQAGSLAVMIAYMTLIWIPVVLILKLPPEVIVFEVVCGLPPKLMEQQLEQGWRPGPGCSDQVAA